MKSIAVILFAFALPATAGKPTFPVTVGSVPDMDACLSVGVVSGLLRKPLIIRSGPGVAHSRKDSLRNGQELYLCDTSKNGEWLGVVYVPGESSPDCGVSSPAPISRAYHGRCKSGWVRATWVKVISG